MTGKRYFGADVHNGAARLLEHRQAIVGECVAAERVEDKTVLEALRVAALKTDAVVYACIVDQGVEAAVLHTDVLDGPATLVRIAQFRGEELEGQPRCLHLGDEIIDADRDSADDDRLSAFCQAGTRDCRADAGRAPGDEDDFVF